MTASLLVLCRANRCRSPFAAELLRRFLRGADVHVESAGLLPGGYEMPAAGQSVGRTLGMDFSGHRSRELDPSALERFDLVLTMSRDQSRDAVLAVDALWPRVFTVVQFARWLGDHEYPADLPLRDWLAETARDRRRIELVGSGDEISDPVDRPAAAWLSMVAELVPPLEIIAHGICAKSR